jgi:hypothetical protein
MPRKVNRRQQLIRLLSEVSAGDVTSVEEMNDIITLKNKLVAASAPAPKAKKTFRIVKKEAQPAEV